MAEGNRIRFAAGLMLSAEEAGITLIAKPDGRIFAMGEDHIVYRRQPELARFKSEVSYLLNHCKAQADIAIRKARAIPAARRVKR